MDNIYIINLDKDTDRLKKTIKQCEKIKSINQPIRISGIYGKHLSKRELNNFVSPLYSKIGSSSAIGCSLSHIKAWKSMLKNNDDTALFLEDDVTINNNFMEYFSKIYPSIPKDYYIIYLGCTVGCSINKKYDIDYPISKILLGSNKYSKKVIKINDNVYTPSLPLALHGYILSKKGAEYLIKCIEKDKINSHIDAQIIKYIYDVPSYAIDPELIKQEDVDINTSNNINNQYPYIINNLLNFKDSHSIPFNYKLSIGHYEIFGQSINTYTYIIFIIGIIFYKTPYKNILSVFILFHIIELYMSKYPINIFIKNSLSSLLTFSISYTITNLVFLNL